MGRRPSITKEAVWAAADQIEAKGGYASLAAVRKVLGGGSYTTITAAMEERKSLPLSGKDLPPPPMPEGLAERFAGLGEEIWASAVIHAHERWRMRISELEDALAVAEATIVSQGDEIKKLREVQR